MAHNKILNIYKPLLKSYFNNSYQKIYIDNTQYENYFLNQSEDLWDVLADKETESILIEEYKKENRSLSLNEYKNLFLSKVNFVNFQKNQDVINKIYQDVSKMYAVLTKFDEMELEYSIDITGGAVRDFVNEKQIKDLDIMLSIYDTDKNKKILNKMNDVLFLKKHFKTDSIIYYLNNVINNESMNEDYILKKQQLMTLCFQDLISEKYTFTSNNREEVMSTKNNYYENMLKTNRLLGVFKLNPEKMKLNYPIDILLTDFSKINFIKDFDFDICKASFSLVNSIYKTDFPKSSLELISRFSAERDFWADIYNKKITMNVDKMSNTSIENSIKKHYKRIQEKYPDYELNIISSDKYENNKKYAMYLYLEEKESLNPKGFFFKKLKI